MSPAVATAVDVVEARAGWTEEVRLPVDLARRTAASDPLAACGFGDGERLR